MKCEHCGANLRMEDAFCPYCGTENPFAKQHRADMERFTEDYKKTREEVLTKSRQFNHKNFKITLTAITIAMAAVLMLLVVFNDSLCYDHERATALRESSSYTEELKELIAHDDYLAVYELMYSKKMNVYYGEGLYEFSDVKSASYNYAEIFEDLLTAQDPSSYSKYAASYISDALKTFYSDRYADEHEEYIQTYLDHLMRDVNLMLKTYLKLNDDEIALLPELSDAERTLLIEEAYNNACGK